VTYFADWAWLPSGCAANVRIRIEDARFVSVEPNAVRGPGDEHVPGLVLPGLANTHSHAFHRALRGRTHGDGGTFWTWRDAMYRLAARLDPDSYRELATAVFAEMALAGVTVVGEFHYVHHQPDGRPYADANAMGNALLDAAATAGIRITLLDACYLSGGLAADGPRPLAAEQARFGDGSAGAWADRVSELPDRPHARVGGAIHSVRAVPRPAVPDIVGALTGRPLHVHLSEQPAENEQCLAAYGCTPTELLAGAGALGPTTTAVHATHLTDPDVVRLGGSRTSISMCPTTERDLADGIGPAARLAAAGSPITLGSDQNAVIDLFEEARGLEMDERLAGGVRGVFAPAELIAALTAAGHRSLGWPDAGRIAVGARADLIGLRLDSVRTAGTLPAQTILAATAADVATVVVDGRVVVSGGRHVAIDVGGRLSRAIAALWT
jgi:formiminoglutamate deiminase